VCHALSVLPLSHYLSGKQEDTQNMRYTSDYILFIDRNNVHPSCTSNGQEMERDDTYFLDNATFLVSDTTLGYTMKRVNSWHYHNDQVGGRLFKVPRRPFEQGSAHLRKLLGDTGPSDVQDDTRPIKLNDISIHDFRELLQLLFPLRV
jgi:hypothetical protein